MLATDPAAMPSQTPDWIAALCKGPLRRHASRLYVTPDGRRIILPLVRLGAGPAAAFVSPVRGWGYGGLVADGGVTAQDVTLVASDPELVRGLLFRIRPSPVQSDFWRCFRPDLVRVSYDSHLVCLADGLEGVTRRLGSSARKGIRTAERSGLTVETAGGARLLPVFFELLDRAVTLRAERSGLPVWLSRRIAHSSNPKRMWEWIAAHMGDRLQVTVVRHGEQAAAVGLVVQDRNAHGMRAAMDPALRHLGASHLMNWTVLQNACRDGCRYFYMGQSANAGVSAFKESFGAKAYQIEEIEWEAVPLWSGWRAAMAAVGTRIGRAKGDRDHAGIARV